MVQIAVDPGKAGAIAVDDGSAVVVTKNSKLSFLDRVKMLTELAKVGDCLFIIEKQWVKPSISRGTGGPSHGNKASWVLSADYTKWLCAAQASGVPIKTIAPQTWMKCIGELSKEYSKRKREIKDVVQSYYSDIKVTLWNADALGICFHFDHLKDIAKDYIE